MFSSEKLVSRSEISLVIAICGLLLFLTVTNADHPLWSIPAMTLFFATVTALLCALVTSAWHIADTGDFNGDGKNDILWRNDNGVVGLWEMNGATPILQTGLGQVGNDAHRRLSGRR